MSNRSLKLLIFLALSCFHLTNLMGQKPPYSGTIFIDPKIIIDSDCSTFSNITYTGRGNKLVYDRRINNWVNLNAYLFNVVWNDSLTSQAVVNPEFTLVEATTEANKYAYKIGQLPHILRTDVKEIWIHKGDFDWGGGNNSLLIHTARGIYYESLGIVEETLVHEASHTSLDAKHAKSSEWKKAQTLDSNFISTYAQQYPIQEDIAESFLTWLAVRHFSARISTVNNNLIKKTIPNRLLYFDAQKFNLNPIPCLTTTTVKNADSGLYKVYPNPTSDILYFETPTKFESSIIIYNAFGQLIQGFRKNTNQIDLSAFPNGIYLICFRDQERITSFKIIKNSR